MAEGRNGKPISPDFVPIATEAMVLAPIGLLMLFIEPEQHTQSSLSLVRFTTPVQITRCNQLGHRVADLVGLSPVSTRGNHAFHPIELVQRRRDQCRCGAAAIASV